MKFSFAIIALLGATSAIKIRDDAAAAKPAADAAKLLKSHQLKVLRLKRLLSQNQLQLKPDKLLLMLLRLKKKNQTKLPMPPDNQLILKVHQKPLINQLRKN